jgi:integrase
MLRQWSKRCVADEKPLIAPNGAMLRSNNWRRHAHWSQALRTTKLAPLTIHDLRHTYASLARRSGADLRYVQKTMGHSTPTVTANIYSDLYSDELDQVATNLDRLHTTATVNTTITGQEPDKTNQPWSPQTVFMQFRGGGPGWDRTSDLPRVKRTLFH